MTNITHTTQHPINPYVPDHLRKRLLFLTDSARRNATHICAGRGSGKSTLLSKIAFLDLVRGVPQILFDGVGGAIDKLIGKLLYLPPEEQQRLSKRILYVDMGNRSHIVSFPLYFRFGNESCYEVSQRYLDVIRRVDPFLMTASVEGWNALWRIGTYTGMLLSSLDAQITEAADLLAQPEAWEHRFAEALTRHPDVAPAVEFFNQYIQMNAKTRAASNKSFLSKVAVFSLDPTLKAQFGSNHQGIDWQEVVEQKMAVLLDFRHVHDLEMRRFKMLWVLLGYFLAFITFRGAGRHQPIAVSIDELAEMAQMQTMGVNPFTQDLDNLINVVARNASLMITACHQEMFQFDERMQKTLLGMGTQIIGSTQDMDAALMLAKNLFPIDPTRIKHLQPVYTSFMGLASAIDQQPTFYTPEEQHYLMAYAIKNQGLFHFLVRPAKAEGDIGITVYPVTIKNFDKDMWVPDELIAKARAILAKRAGRPVADILAEIDSRRKPRQAASSIAIINSPPTYGNDLHPESSDDDDWLEPL